MLVWSPNQNLSEAKCKSLQILLSPFIISVSLKECEGATFSREVMSVTFLLCFEINLSIGKKEKPTKQPSKELCSLQAVVQCSK